MEDYKVELDKRTVYIDEKKYWYESESDRAGDTIRVWFRYGKTTAYLVDEIGSARDRVSLEEIKKMDERRGDQDGPIDWIPAERRVEDKDKIKLLNKLVNESKATRREQKGRQAKETVEAEQKSASSKHLSAQSRVETGQGQRNPARKSSQSSLSFALKSVASDYVLNIRVAPSKKK